MQEIADWLKQLGMSEYTERFAENDIDTSVLRHLTDQDLKELGVSLGHRRKMLAAIAELAVAAPASPQPALTEPKPQDTAERRQITVMFCDLVGSTALSARMDPEDLREVISTYQKCVAETVRRFDGFVAKYMGDGVLVYFGYPRAHEDEAERAVRASLDIIAAVRRLETRAGNALDIRVGIATGLVVVGDLIGEGASQERVVVGETPNLAARLQALAEPGSVVVAASTRRLLGGLFKLRDLGRHVVKGLAEPVTAWVIEGLADSESRFEAVHAVRMTGLAGRKDEIDFLSECQRLAWKGQGQVVLISGEAGVGKSRVAASLSERLAGELYTRLRYQCSPYHANTALYPFIAQIERAAGFEASDPPDRRLDKLETVLAISASQVATVAPLFAALLSIPTAARYPQLGLSPAQQRRKTLSAMLDQLEGLARGQPVLQLFEDAHWADATSRELIDLEIERVRQLPVLLIITFRPEFEPPWAGLPGVSTLALGRLDRRHVQTIVEQLTGGRSLPAEVMEHIVIKTDGVPLFVEELTKAVLEAGILVEEADRYRLEGPLPALAIPATLHDSLMARLDRLAPVKEIAQIGAAIGREFSFPLLSAVVARDEGALKLALTQLEEAELVFRHGEPPEAVYSFKHALVQDAAYESLLKGRRQVLHRRIAEVLCDRFPASAEKEPAVVAHHFTHAGLTDAAVEWHGKAGDQAIRRSAYVEAIAHLGKAISLAEGLTDEPAHRLLRLRLQIAYGNALIATRGHAAPEATAAFARAQEIAARIDDVTERFPAYFGIWASTYVRGELALFQDVADTFLRDADSQPGSPEAGIAHRVFGSTCWYQGDFARARAHLEQAVAASDAERDHALSFRFVQEPGVSAMLFLALVLWPLGEVDQACRLAEEAVAHAAQNRHVPTLVWSHCHRLHFEAMRCDASRAIPHAEALVGLGREHDLPLWLAAGIFYQGWARWHAGDRESGTAGMREGMAQFRDQGSVWFKPLFGTLLAQAEGQVGRVEAGLAQFGDLQAEIEQTGQHWFDAEMHRQRGELLLRRAPDETAAAEGAFMLSLAVARRQQTKTFELRAATSLARLWRRQGKRDEARDLLAPVYGWFTEGFDTLDLKEARALLNELAS
jgi:class 3 adenylate cyclase/predicted ATPase